METLFARLRLSDRTGDLQMSTLRFMVMALASKEKYLQEDRRLRNERRR